MREKDPQPGWITPADIEFFEVEDLYKYLHQAYMGPGHAIASKQEAEAYLREEWSSLGAAQPGEQLLEVIAQRGPFVRVHLRPYRDSGGSLDSLFEAFLQSAETQVDSAGFIEAWTRSGAMIRAGQLPFQPSAFEKLESVVKQQGYPAIHHSEGYLKRRNPAYRVLSRAEAERLLERLKDGSKTEEQRLSRRCCFDRYACRTQ